MPAPTSNENVKPRAEQGEAPDRSPSNPTPKPRVGITGATGSLGKALTQQLAHRFDLSLMSRSLDGTDLMDLSNVIERFRNLDAVVHLAWQYADSHAPDPAGYFDNIQMNRNVLLAATTVGVKKVLLASSVHADYFYDWQGPPLLDPHQRPRANGPYGCAKVIVEELARSFASETLNIACLRYGAVTPDDQPHPTDSWERRVWLSHRDLGSLIHLAITQDWPDPFALCYAVSDNQGRAHDLTNPFHWQPQDAAPTLQ